FELLKDAQKRVLDLQYWHDFMNCIHQAGFRSSKMISSQNNLLFTYMLYLIGRTEYNVPEFDLRKVISLWFFMASVTGRYTSSPESAMEFDLARLRGLRTHDDFIKTLKDVCKITITGDFWTMALPNDLATSSPRSPSLFAYQAALVLLDANALFSKMKISDLLDPSVYAKRTAIERHHLFPKKYLRHLGIESVRDTNQIANYALVEWGDNADISSRAPVDYLPEMKKRFNNQELERMYYWHALPDNWENMDYREFLLRRRELIASVIRDAYSKLTGQSEKETHPVRLDQLWDNGETGTVEFKSTLRINLHTGEKDPRIELSTLKTIAAFLNSNGGTLIIGVADDSEPVGLDKDEFASEDKMHLHLVNLLNDRIGPQHMIYIHPQFDDYKGRRIMVVNCLRGKSPVFVKDGRLERFYVRTGAATMELFGEQMQSFIDQRFKI
ncbi:MAG: hypothetical protein GX887_09165, partial [Firmicutes bacterium]|nr:hypothetical protein [Bacillota bacterium]